MHEFVQIRRAVLARCTNLPRSGARSGPDVWIWPDLVRDPGKMRKCGQIWRAILARCINLAKSGARSGYPDIPPCNFFALHRICAERRFLGFSAGGSGFVPDFRSNSGDFQARGVWTVGREGDSRDSGGRLFLWGTLSGSAVWGVSTSRPILRSRFCVGS